MTGFSRAATLETMDIELSSDQQAFIRDGIRSGRFKRPEDAVQEALLLWEERERRRLEILTAVGKAEDSLARGGGRTVRTREEAQQLAQDVKRRGRARLDAEQKPSGG